MEKTLPEQMREHIETCKECTPIKACAILLALHSQFLRSIEAPRHLETADDSKLYELFNPKCTHERCSWDIINCDACIAYSKEQQKLKSQAAKAEDALENLGDKSG